MSADRIRSTHTQPQITWCPSDDDGIFFPLDTSSHHSLEDGTNLLGKANSLTCSLDRARIRTEEFRPSSGPLVAPWSFRLDGRIVERMSTRWFFSGWIASDFHRWTTNYWAQAVPIFSLLLLLPSSESDNVAVWQCGMIRKTMEFVVFIDSRVVDAYPSIEKEQEGSRELRQATKKFFTESEEERVHGKIKTERTFVASESPGRKSWLSE